MNLRYLTDAYQPNKIIGRDKQIKEIKKVIKLFKEKGASYNKLIQGVTGSGKTATIQSIISKEEKILFTSGMICKTSQLILNFLCDSNYRNKSMVLIKLIKQLKENPKIIIIDEIHKIRDYKDLMQDLNSIFREAYIPIIIITNKRQFLKDIDDDVKLTLLFEKISFPSYNAFELNDILGDRLRTVDVKIPPDIKNHICAVGAKVGSARVALDLVYRCVLENKFTQKFVKECLEKKKELDWEEFISSIPNPEKRVLKIILEVYSSKGKVFTMDIVKKMKDYSPGRISQLVTSLESYDVIETKVINKGRAGGRFRSIEFVSKEVFDKLDELIGI